ncbi:hypothetical protein [Acaryochloris marina]|uniref:hypothetical protein n=1 Tax=Acaryochloris marina TaxID=155978 RepID=UPI0021C33CE3|nr:hypothetical protein [Acaryochloris marina]BDM83827.1 hypothetical protein AM10699_66880 [Acaryochloris marina MBIC10699]
MNSTTTQPQATTKPVLTILEDVTDADQFVVICGMKFIGYIRRDADGGFYPVYGTLGDFNECGDLASLKETAAQQLLEYREMELGQAKLYGQPEQETRPNYHITKDGRRIPVSYGKPAPKRTRSTSATVGRSNVAAIGYRGGPGELINGVSIG